MADEPKPESTGTPAPDPAGQASGAPATPPAGTTPPADSTTAPAAGSAPADPNAPAAPGPPPDPLSDGTTPTVLKTGNGHRSVPKGKVSLNTVYRRADIITTLFTFLGAIVAAALILGGYWYFNRSKTNQPTEAPKVTSLDKAELEKLGAFFEGNAAGTPNEILTISSASLFKGRVAVSSDVKITGSLEVSGPTTLADLTVNKVTNLGVTNVKGATTIDGPFNTKSSALFGGGVSVTGGLSATGNGTFGGSVSAGAISVKDISISGTLNLAGHLSLSGQAPSAAATGIAGGGASATVDGNDAAGTVTINTGALQHRIPDIGGLLVNVNFRSAYPRVPKVIITPIGQQAGKLDYYVTKTATGFTIGVSTDAPLAANTSYAFDFWTVQ